MRRTLILCLASLALMGLSASESATDPALEATEPQTVNIVGACTSPAPRVAPPSITVNGVDEVQWRDPSGQAVSFTIEPKTVGAWPFVSASHGAERGGTAATGPVAGSTLGGQPVEQGQVYEYKVTLVCPAGPPRTMEAEIVIGVM